jgi:ankyrin repeat protein
MADNKRKAADYDSDRHVDIRSVAGNQIIGLHLDASDTIKTIKQCIQRECMIQVFRQELLFGMSVLEDTETLVAYPQLLVLTLVLLSYDDKMRSPLFASVLAGDMLGAVQALRGGADPDCIDANGRTPLYCAAQMGHTPLVRLLVEARVDVDRPSLGGVSTPLAVAAARGHLPIVVILVIAGADKDMQVLDCVTPLWLAARHGHDRIVKYLCRVGANVNKPAPQGPPKPRVLTSGYHPGGSSPLWIAAADKQFKIVKLLCEAGGDYQQCNQEGVTPALIALRLGLARQDWVSIGLSLYLALPSFSHMLCRLASVAPPKNVYCRCAAASQAARAA